MSVQPATVSERFKEGPCLDGDDEPTADWEPVADDTVKALQIISSIIHVSERF